MTRKGQEGYPGEPGEEGTEGGGAGGAGGRGGRGGEATLAISRRALAAFLGLWAATVVAFFFEGKRQHDTATKANNTATLAAHSAVKLSIVQFAGCRRLNVERAQTNRQGLATYKLYRLVDIVTRQAPRTPSSKVFLVVIDEEIKTLTWIPLTNCIAAQRGAGYPVPAPVSYSTALPPHTALYLGPSN